jgi:hypothetical protein
MSMSRRGFLGALAAGFAAPAIVRSESLMRIIVPKRDVVILQPLYLNEFGKRGDHSHDVFRFFTDDGGVTWDGKLEIDYQGELQIGKNVLPLAQRILDDMQKEPAMTRPMALAFQNDGKHTVVFPSNLRWQ